MPGISLPQALLLDLRKQQQAMVHLLRTLVRAESPSFDKAAVDRCGEILAAEWRRRGARVDVLAQKHRGNHLRVKFWRGPRNPSGQILILGHLDTVYELGTLARMPFKVSRGRAWGPGTFDMKAGLIQALFAADALERCRVPVAKRLVFLWTSDEEIGSESSRDVIEREARRSDAVLVLEPAQGPSGDLKTSRKGVGEFELEVTGRAAHAGLDPQNGVNAVHELAQQIVRVVKLNDYRRGVTVNADIVHGGTRSNVIADHARAVIDVRARRSADMRALTRKLRGLRPILLGARIRMSGKFNRPPLERKITAMLFRQAQSLAQEMGLSLDESTAGGGSDGNLTGALGVPTLDGLGAVGAGAHGPSEHVVVRALPERAALLAALMASL